MLFVSLGFGGSAGRDGGEGGGRIGARRGRIGRGGGEGRVSLWGYWRFVEVAVV